MADILIIDDDPVFCKALTLTLQKRGYSIRLAHTLAQGREYLRQFSCSVAFIDVYLPDGNGLDLLPELSLLPAPPEPIIITALGDADAAENAIASGAWDYIPKPANMPAVLRMVQRACAAHQKKQQRLRILHTSDIVGNSPPLRHALAQMYEAAQSDGPVLIRGETGTGKELAARAIHKNSRRAKGPFVVVDCGAISPTLIESELFGNVRGAFTGAAQSRQGLVLLADGGTLFLDEVGELSLDLQKVFLRVLQERSFRPVGSTGEVPSDFRILAATNRDLAAMAKNDRFRFDLLYRLQGAVIELPPLRLRGEDIPSIARHALAKSAARYGIKPQDFDEEALAALASYAWPGNVREMLHTIEHAALAGQEEPQIHLEHLPLPLRASVARLRLEEKKEDPTVPAPLPTGQPAEAIQSWQDFQNNVLHAHKKAYLLHLLRHTQGDVPTAAALAGVSRQRFYTLLREHRISRKWESPL